MSPCNDINAATLLTVASPWLRRSDTSCGNPASLICCRSTSTNTFIAVGKRIQTFKSICSFKYHDRQGVSTPAVTILHSLTQKCWIRSLVSRSAVLFMSSWQVYTSRELETTRDVTLAKDRHQDSGTNKVKTMPPFQAMCSIACGA